jgi:HUS1 checkpoint protein
LTNINHFTQIVATVSKLCSKGKNDKSCIMKLTTENIYFILPESTNTLTESTTIGRSSFWLSIETNSLCDFYICEGKSSGENFILLEIQPEVLLRALKSSQNLKMVKIKLTKRQTTCLTVELDIKSMISTARVNTRTITHDIPTKVISTSKASIEDFNEPSIGNANLSIHLPQLKLFKHMLERMKNLSDFVILQATNKGTFTLKIEAEAASVSSYFTNLQNLKVPNQDEDENDEDVSVSIRLSLKKMNDFVAALQFNPSKMICNFVDRKYAHFFVIHNEDTVLQFLISSIFH